MTIKNIPYKIITGIALIVITTIVIVFSHGKNVPAPANISSAQKTDSSIGVYTDTIQNKSALSVPSTTNPVTTTVSVPNACTLQLAISKRSTDAGTGNYTVTVGNEGKTACTSASLSLYYDDNETYSDATPTPTSSGYYWQFGTLGYGETKSIALTTTIQPAGITSPLQGCLSADNGSDACTTTGASQPIPVAASAPVASAVITSGAKIPIQPGQEAGVWEWNDVESMTATDMDAIAKEAAANGFTAIYLTIDHYLDLHYETDTAQQAVDVSNYSKALESFISTAEKYGIAVDAEAGWRDWGEPAQQQKAIDVLSYVAQFNSTEPVKIRGMQYDVESYLLPQYTTDQTTTLQHYVGLADILQKQASAAGIPLTLVIPHFYDSTQQWTPAIAYNGTTDYTFNQLLAILGRNPGNRMIVMAYRNTATGADSATALAQTEIEDATTAGNGTKIIVAQETGNVDPSYVTFYNTSRNALFSQITTVNNTFAQDSAYGGIAIDYLDPFLKLK